jgi:hypothetical protein
MKAPWLTRAKVKKGTLFGGKYLGKSNICGKNMERNVAGPFKKSWRAPRLPPLY